jgi:DNA-directed RNA polymerase II subunit RPB1
MVFRIRLTGNTITDVVTELKGLEFNIMEKIIISGVSKIKKASINKKKSKILSKEAIFKVYEDFEEHVLETDGTNLVDVLGNKYVDNTRTISNDIMEIYETLGVEAARQALYNEIKDILNDSTSVNHRHIALLVDTMTCKGYLLSIDRHGINRSDIGPLAKCSFEETSDILIKAGIFGERDKITGVSANIILGQIAQCGTGDSKISMDTEAIDRLLSTEEEDTEGSDACEEGFCEDIEDCMIDFELKMGAPSGAIEKRTMDELVVY